MDSIPCRDRDEFTNVLNSPTFAQRREFERFLATRFTDAPSFAMPGICCACDKPVDFFVDWQYGAQVEAGVRIPNWRERLVCPHCEMNNRQRALITYTLPAIKRVAAERKPRVFLLEQVTPTFRWYSQNCTQAECIGSEWFGPDVPSGTIRDGIRHEDCERLSFGDESIDFIISNEVMEHVSNPVKALQEKARILRPGGEMFMTAPFWINQDKNVVRARIANGELEHLLPKVFHGNPMSSEGSLVFTDFGWEFLDDIRNAGFSNVSLNVYWSLEHGHIGGVPFYFHAIK